MERKKVKDDNLPEKGRSGSPMLTRKSKSEWQTEVVNAVFNNPLLMDTIVKYSIYSSNGKRLTNQTLVAIRLVNKVWLQSASHVLKQSGEGLIKIFDNQLEKYFLNMRKSGSKKRNILDQCVSVYSKYPCSFESILPIYLSIGQFSFKKGNTKNLTNLFEKCNGLISQLSLEYPLDGSSMNLKLKCNSLYFSILRSLQFEFVTWSDPRKSGDKSPASESSANGLEFLQQILQNSENLRSFTLTNPGEAAVNISSLILPKTIKSLSLRRRLSGNMLTVLTKNSLPNLIALELGISEQSEVALMYNILQRFGHQLTSLSINVRKVDGNARFAENTHIFIEFPLMEKLKCLTFSGKDFDIFPHCKQIWSNLVPNLTQLLFKNLKVFRESILLEWIKGLRFENVKKLQFLPNCNDDDRQDSMSPSVEMIREIITSFPNIEKLTLKIRFVETSGLKYLFKNFTRLKRLHLEFEFENPDASTGDKMLSLFLGISFKQAFALVINAENIKNVSVDNPESITNLKELCALTLKAPHFYCQGRPNNPLCSDIFSKYGLEKMPKLEKIKLLGKFEILQ